jgi:hypothetical protein
MRRTQRFPVALPKADRMEFLDKVMARKRAELELVYAEPMALVYVPLDLTEDFKEIVGRVKPP